MKIPSPRLNSHVEIRFCLYLYAKTEEIRKHLKEFFFEDHFQVMLYAVCLLGVLYSPKPEERCWKNLLSHIYPALPLDEEGRSSALLLALQRGRGLSKPRNQPDGHRNSQPVL